MTQVPSLLSQEISTLDSSEPRSVVNLVPKGVGQSILDASFEHPEWFDLDERELHKLLHLDNKSPTPTDHRLRLKFWMEYDRVQGLGLGTMNMVNVTAGVCSKEYFFKKYMENSAKVAWLLCPPTGYATKTEEALNFGIDQLRDLLEIPHIVGGRLDTKIAEVKIKIVAMLDMRVKGALVQKTMNLHANVSNKQVEKLAQNGTAEDLMKELKELERQNRKAQNLPQGKPDIDIK